MMNMTDEAESESDAKVAEASELLASSSSIGSPRFVADVIKVRAIPEKRGGFLKHTEYEITSEKFKSKVERRYSDFSTLHGYLLARYTNRMIPRPPPKQIMLDSFIEERRCGLQRWLRLISQHPVISSDEILKAFLTVSEGDHLQQMQEVFNVESDELSQLSKDFKVPHVDLFTLVSSRETMRTRLNQVVKLKRLLEQQAKREIVQSRDFQELSSTLTAMSPDTFKDFSEKLAEISEESGKVSERQQLAVTERFLMIIDVLTASSDLCERVDKNLDADASRRNFGEFYEHEVKRRKSFALFCVAEETKFAEKYLKLLPSILLQFSFEESKGLGKIAESFKKIVDIESDKINCEDGK